jgi:hypothetical protein
MFDTVWTRYVRSSTNSQAVLGHLLVGAARGLGTCRKRRVERHGAQAHRWVAPTLMGSVGGRHGRELRRGGLDVVRVVRDEVMIAPHNATE